MVDPMKLSKTAEGAGAEMLGRSSTVHNRDDLHHRCAPDVHDLSAARSALTCVTATATPA
jgi:hypothetical protein